MEPAAAAHLAGDLLVVLGGLTLWWKLGRLEFQMRVLWMEHERRMKLFRFTDEKDADA